MVAVYIILVYLALLVGLGVFSSRMFKGTSSDYFLASRGIGPFPLDVSFWDDDDRFRTGRVDR